MIESRFLSYWAFESIMKAVLCKTYGPPEDLVMEDVPDPVPGENEAVIEVYAASLNFPDGLQIQSHVCPGGSRARHCYHGRR